MSDVIRVVSDAIRVVSDAIRDVSDNLQVFLWEGSFFLSFPPRFFFLHATFGSVLCAFPLLLSSFCTLHLGVFFVHFLFFSSPLFFLHATFGSVLCAFPLLLLSSFYTLHLGAFFVHFLFFSSPLFFLHATFGSVLCAFALLLLSSFYTLHLGAFFVHFLFLILLASFYTLHLRKPFFQNVIVSHSCLFSRYPCYTCYQDGKAGVPRSVVSKTDASKCLLSVDPRRRAEHPATLKFKFRFLPAEFSRRTLSGQPVSV